jgi:hypothetical protein
MKPFPLFCLLVVLSTPLYSQSNEMLDLLLTQSPARYGETCYLALTAAGRLPEAATPAVAFAEARASGLVAARAGQSDPVRLDELSLLVMKAFGMKGGVMYSLFPVERYAFRELAYRGVVSAGDRSARYVSGEEVIRIIRTALELKEAGR